MTENTTVQQLIDKNFKLIVGIPIVCLALGFLVKNMYLASHNAYSADPLHIKYIYIGAATLFYSALLLVFSVFAIDFDRKVKIWKSWLTTGGRIIIATGFIYSLLVVDLNVISSEYKMFFILGKYYFLALGLFYFFLMLSCVVSNVNYVAFMVNAEAKYCVFLNILYILSAIVLMFVAFYDISDCIRIFTTSIIFASLALNIVFYFQSHHDERQEVAKVDVRHTYYFVARFGRIVLLFGLILLAIHSYSTDLFPKIPRSLGGGQSYKGAVIYKLGDHLQSAGGFILEENEEWISFIDIEDWHLRYIPKSSIAEYTIFQENGMIPKFENTNNAIDVVQEAVYKADSAAFMTSYLDTSIKLAKCEAFLSVNSCSFE